MNRSLAVRAGVVQALAVALLFALLVALPLPADFFRRFGPATGPVAWMLCAAVTARVLRLPAGPVLTAAVGAGLAAAVAGFAVSHGLGLVVGVVVFGLACGSPRLGAGRPGVAAAK